MNINVLTQLSPDLNPTETLWKHFKIAVQFPSNLTELEVFCEEE